MKKNNVLFMAMTGASVVLISAIIANNITSMQSRYAVPAVAAMISNPKDALKTNAVRQEFNRKGLVLHEGKYWKEIHE